MFMRDNSLCIKYSACCVFGHRDIEENFELPRRLYYLFEDFILHKNIDTFYFGGFGDFDSLCHEIVTELKEKYPHIQRVYVFDDYKYISRPRKRPKWLKDEDYESFEYFDMSYTGFYKRIFFRNCEIINHSDICVFYVDTSKTKSGALKALEYAKRKKKEIINVFDTS